MSADHPAAGKVPAYPYEGMREIECWRCKGKGWKFENTAGGEPEPEPCDDCGATGRRFVRPERETRGESAPLPVDAEGRPYITHEMLADDPGLGSLILRTEGFWTPDHPALVWRGRKPGEAAGATEKDRTNA